MCVHSRPCHQIEQPGLLLMRFDNVWPWVDLEPDLMLDVIAPCHCEVYSLLMSIKCKRWKIDERKPIHSGHIRSQLEPDLMLDVAAACQVCSLKMNIKT